MNSLSAQVSNNQGGGSRDPSPPSDFPSAQVSSNQGGSYRLLRSVVIKAEGAGIRLRRRTFRPLRSVVIKAGGAGIILRR